ncbi:hypothetical protein CKF58_06415 [Psittacicella hinzii]|uniref:Uncharacterized protein n=2 Tax=Psittacicella hinzii TaxID=2028575 RepID=A0A3A1YDW4_9GAMM|nr:hypothetical protein CKF58_06415 [Psittacicella hinzii]
MNHNSDLKLRKIYIDQIKEKYDRLCNLEFLHEHLGEQFAQACDAYNTMISRKQFFIASQNAANPEAQTQTKAQKDPEQVVIDLAARALANDFIKSNTSIKDGDLQELIEAQSSNLVKVKQAFTIEYDSPVGENYLNTKMATRKYAGLRLPSSFRKNNFSFNSSKFYACDTLNQEEYDFMRNIIDNRILPTNQSELQFLNYNTLRFYVTEAYTFLKVYHLLSLQFHKFLLSAIELIKNPDWLTSEYFGDNVKLVSLSLKYPKLSQDELESLLYLRKDFKERAKDKESDQFVVATSKFYDECGFNILLNDNGCLGVFPIEFYVNLLKDDLTQTQQKLKKYVNSLGSKNGTINTARRDYYIHELLDNYLYSVVDITGENANKLPEIIAKQEKTKILPPLIIGGLEQINGGLFLGKDDFTAVGLNYHYSAEYGWNILINTAKHECGHYLDHYVNRLKHDYHDIHKQYALGHSGAWRYLSYFCFGSLPQEFDPNLGTLSFVAQLEQDNKYLMYESPHSLNELKVVPNDGSYLGAKSETVALEQEFDKRLLKSYKNAYKNQRGLGNLETKASMRQNNLILINGPYLITSASSLIDARLDKTDPLPVVHSKKM